MKLNRKVVSRFKQFFHGERLATVQVFKEREDCNVEPRIGTSEFQKEHLDAFRRLNQKGAAICMMINRGSGKGRKSTDVTDITALFVDADGSPDLQTLKRAAVRPHLIVETSPGHYHAYWRTQGVPLEGFGEAQKQLAEQFGSDRQVCDLSRAMRVPGSINWKHGEPFQVRVIYRDEEAKPIKWKRFAAQMQLTGTAKRAALVGADGASGGQDLSFDVAKLKEALAKIPPDDRSIWLRVGMAIHSALPNRGGRELWDEWSRRSTKFQPEDQETTWRYFKNGGGIKLATIFWLAERHSSGLPPDKPLWPNNEIELGQLFARNHVGALRYVQSEDVWYAWDQSRWKRDKIAAQKYAQSFLLDERDAANRAGLKGDGGLSVANAKNILQAAKVEVDLQARRADFDAHPDILAVKNGVVELSTGLFRTARPADYVSCRANVTYDPNADCPTWRTFLTEVTNGDKELRRFLRMAVGYTLFGHTVEQKMFLLIGEGANGKGVFLHTLAKILGDYACAVQASLLRPNYGSANGPSPALTAIKGRRLLMCSEMPKNKPFDEAFVKQLTGSDPVSGRGLYAEQEEFTPVGKLWLSVNSMPKVRFDDGALWRRIVPIPFERRFLGRRADPYLEDKLMAESSGILNWALSGSKLYWCKGRLRLCERCIEFRDALHGREDTVGAWIRSECKRDPDGEVQARRAYESYSVFMKAERADPLNRAEFKAALVSKGFRHRKRNSSNVYEGLRLRAPQ